MALINRGRKQFWNLPGQRFEPSAKCRFIPDEGREITSLDW
jgi:hypothetical protein